ncbi:Nif11-like leader peptide family natural product precursor [Stella sp.]|jgi:hypothetical protein|uniref:Nif11-like leader peptide family natural product precursor n=1 Tax=Stella sp. TaxID=2912054 RepID=UPI0035B0B6C6
MTDPSLEEFLALARHAGLEFTEEEAPRMHEGWRRMQSMLLSRLPADPDLTDEPALVFVAAGAGIAR